MGLLLLHQVERFKHYNLKKLPNCSFSFSCYLVICDGCCLEIHHCRAKLVLWSLLYEQKCSIKNSLYYVLKIVVIGVLQLMEGQ